MGCWGRELTVAKREACVGLELEAPAQPAVHSELVLEGAVTAGVVSRADAELIAATGSRRSGCGLAGHWGVGYEALPKRRQRAEAALAGWLADQGDVPAGTRLRDDPRTRSDAERRTKQGKTSKDIMRCVKRYLPRELLPLLKADLQDDCQLS